MDCGRPMAVAAMTTSTTSPVAPAMSPTAGRASGGAPISRTVTCTESDAVSKVESVTTTDRVAT